MSDSCADGVEGSSAELGCCIVTYSQERTNTFLYDTWQFSCPQAFLGFFDLLYGVFILVPALCAAREHEGAGRSTPLGNFLLFDEIPLNAHPAARGR